MPAPQDGERSLALPTVPADGTRREASQITPPSSWVSPRLRLTLRQLRKSKSAMFGAVIVCLVLLTALLADFIAPYDPTEMFHQRRLEWPSATYWMGTDQMGRDVFSRIIHGSRVSLFVGIVSISFAILLGLPLGFCAGYYGGAVDNVIMRLMDIWISFPIFLLALVIMAILEPSVNNVALALAIVQVPVFARIVRGTTLSVKENDYVEAGRAVALPDSRLIMRYILPNCFAPIIVLATVSIGVAIIVEAGLSFLGMGAQPPTPSWGYDLKANLVFIEDNPWIAISPGLAIFFTVLGLNMFGDGLRDALDPRLKE
ncbi:MAG: ABC transporter permease [Candidatus Tectomicrobia bacterium]